jgi:hypothetical protein
MTDFLDDNGLAHDAELKSIVSGPQPEVAGKVATQRLGAAYIRPVPKALDQTGDASPNRAAERRIALLRATSSGLRSLVNPKLD